MTIAAVSAFPLDWRIFLEHFTCLNVLQQFVVSAFMVNFYFCNHPESCGNIFETLFLGYFSQSLGKVCPTRVFRLLQQLSDCQLLMQLCLLDKKL